MPLTTTAGYTFIDGEVVTATKLGLHGTPTVPDGQNGAFANVTQTQSIGVDVVHALNQAGVGQWTITNKAGSGDLYTSIGGNDWIILGRTSGSVAFAGGINGSTIGAITPAAGKFTTLTATALSTAGLVANSAAGVFSTVTDVSRLTYTDAGTTRVTADFGVTASTTTVAVTGLSAALAAGATYSFEAYLYVSTDASHGGWKAAMSRDGTLTSTNYVDAVQSWFFSGTPSAVLGLSNSALAAVGGGGFPVTTAVNGSGLYVITGIITVNVAGSIGVQFAQQTAAGTSTVLRGSWLRVRKIS